MQKYPISYYQLLSLVCLAIIIFSIANTKPSRLSEPTLVFAHSTPLKVFFFNTLPYIGGAALPLALIISLTFYGMFKDEVKGSFKHTFKYVYPVSFIGLIISELLKGTLI